MKILGTTAKISVKNTFFLTEIIIGSSELSFVMQKVIEYSHVCFEIGAIYQRFWTKEVAYLINCHRQKCHVLK